MRHSDADVSRNGMDLGRTGRASLHGDVRLAPNLYGPIATVRREQLNRIVTQIRVRREPRVCLYAFAVDGKTPAASLKSAAAYAAAQSWQVVAAQCDFDSMGGTALESRSGWGLVRDHVRAGFADGVVVVSADVVSADVDVYWRELEWFALRFAFVALVVPETERLR